MNYINNNGTISSLFPDVDAHAKKMLHRAKYSRDWTRRCWYYDQCPTDIEAKQDEHPEIRRIYYQNHFEDNDWQNDNGCRHLVAHDRNIIL